MEENEVPPPPPPPMLQTRQKVLQNVPKCLKMSNSDAPLSERTCYWGLGNFSLHLKPNEFQDVPDAPSHISMLSVIKRIFLEHHHCMITSVSEHFLNKYCS